MDEKNAKEFLKEGEQNIKKLASAVDCRVKENPWPVIAGVGLVAIFMGFLMGRGAKN